MIQLSDEQEQALVMMQNCIANAEQIACLVYGSAGTGKSILISKLVNYLEDQNIPYCLCAPTHKAALVMQKYTDRKANTLHKLLNLSPNIQIFELDLRNLLFKVNGASTNIPYNGVIICDEASMINDDLYMLLIQKARELKSHICFFGDFKQLAPVKQESLSKIISTTPQMELTKIYRQDSSNELLPILATLRTEPIQLFKENANLQIEHKFKDFIKLAKHYLHTGILSKDILAAKLAAYTNARVDAYNTLFHNLLFGSEYPYYKGEILTCHDNLEFNNNHFYNSMDYIIVEQPQYIDIDIPGFKAVPGWKLLLYDTLEGFNQEVVILDSDNVCYSELAEFLENLRIQAIQVSKVSKLKAKTLWTKYYQAMNAFTTPRNIFFDGRLIRHKSFSYGYASTVHKLQGSNYDNILIDIKDILDKCKNAETIRQLEYVALSRTRSNAIIFE